MTRNSDILTLIKKRATTRIFTKKNVSKNFLNKILAAGIWGPTVISSQVARFIVVESIDVKNKLCRLLAKKLEELGTPGQFLVGYPAIRTLKSARIIVAVYNSGDLSFLVERRFAKFLNKPAKKRCFMIAEESEISAVSAAMQNMILVAESLGLGSCWLVMPTYCADEINKVLCCHDKLVAFLALGYPAVRGKRTRRLYSFSKQVKFAR